MKPKKGYLVKTDMIKNINHYIPKGGRSHIFDNCWCFPVTDSFGGVHHHYMKAGNKARC